MNQYCLRFDSEEEVYTTLRNNDWTAGYETEEGSLASFYMKGDCQLAVIGNIYVDGELLEGYHVNALGTELPEELLPYVITVENPQVLWAI